MIGIRWTDPPDDPAELFGWQLPSLVLATLFFNIFFWYVPATDFSFSSSGTGYFACLSMVVACVLALFFLAPAFAAHDSRRSLFQVAEASFGVVPAVGFRVGCAALCVLWVAALCGPLIYPVLELLLQRSLSTVEGVLFSGVLILFLFATGLQNLRTSGKLAFFTDKLGAALLIAAAIRVGRYLPVAWGDLRATDFSPNQVSPRIAAELLMIIGPMALLGSDYGCRTRTRKDVALIGFFGLAVPMSVTLVAVAVLQRAAYHSRMDLGHLANIAVALWGGDSIKYRAQWIVLALVTVFGCARFNVRMWRAAVAPMASGRKSWPTVLFATVLIGVALSASDSTKLAGRMEFSAGLAACVAAIISGDYLSGRWRTQRKRTVDWWALVSLAAGCGAGVAVWYWAATYGEDRQAESIVLPWAASFASCLLGRAVQQRAESRRL